MTSTTADAAARPTHPAPATVVGVVGVGAMGLPMAMNLHGHGYAVRAVDLSSARVEQCRTAGMAADTGLDLLAGCDVVLVMVATGHQLRELLDAPVVTDGRLRGAVLAVGSTVGHVALQEAAAQGERHGIRVVDCPVSGGVAGAVSGTLTVFAAGDAAGLRVLAPVLAPVGTVRVVGARPGDGQRVKLVNQMLTSIHLAAAGEALAFAERLGLDVDLVRELLPTGAAASWMLADRGPRMTMPAAERPTETQLSVFVKDSGLVAEAAEAAGAHAPLTRGARSVWERAAELGLGDGDDSGVIEVFRRG